MLASELGSKDGEVGGEAGKSWPVPLCGGGPATAAFLSPPLGADV